MQSWVVFRTISLTSVPTCARPSARTSHPRVSGCESLIQRLVLNPLRVQLLVDIGRQPHLLDAGDIARSRAKPNPVEDVDDGPGVGFRRDAGSLRRNRAGQQRQQGSSGDDNQGPLRAKRWVAHTLN